MFAKSAGPLASFAIPCMSIPYPTIRRSGIAAQSDLRILFETVVLTVFISQKIYAAGAATNGTAGFNR